MCRNSADGQRPASADALRTGRTTPHPAALYLARKHAEELSMSDPYQPHSNQPPYQSYAPPPAPPPPPGRNRTVLIVSLAVVAVLIGFAAAVTVAYALTRDDDTPAASAAADGEKRLRLTAPDRIGPWTKATGQTTANQLSAALDSDVIDEPFAAQYDNNGTTAAIWGGIGAHVSEGTGQEIFGGFLAATQKVKGGTLGTAVMADPGIIGGEAWCLADTRAGITMTVCLWVADQVVLGLLFDGSDAEAASGSLRVLLPGLLAYR
jgi:hypothetical protein